MGRRGRAEVTLVGKGVCFDTGGLDIKPDSAMLIMKKDMGGAANVLAAAHMIMDAKLKVRLRVLIPAVENAIAGARSGRSTSTPRARVSRSRSATPTPKDGWCSPMRLRWPTRRAPELIVDMATLTGAARVALGPELPPFYTHDDTLAADLARHADAERDPMWRLPLWRPYQSLLDSKTADINNVGGPMAGRLRRRCSSIASCPPQRRGRISTSMDGRRAPSLRVRMAANAKSRVRSMRC